MGHVGTRDRGRVGTPDPGRRDVTSRKWGHVISEMRGHDVRDAGTEKRILWQTRRCLQFLFAYWFFSNCVYPLKPFYFLFITNFELFHL